MDEIKEEKKEEIKEETPQDQEKANVEEVLAISKLITELFNVTKLKLIEELLKKTNERIDFLEDHLDDLIELVGQLQDRPTSSITNVFHQERGGVPLNYESIKRNIME